MIVDNDDMWLFFFIVSLGRKRISLWAFLFASTVVAYLTVDV